MKTKPVLLLILLLSFLSAAAYFAMNSVSTETKRLPLKDEQRATLPSHTAGKTEMALAAQVFLTSLSEAQSAEARFDFENDERKNFNFVPMTRKGLIFSEMNDAQRKLCLALVQTGLSGKGYAQAIGIMSNENILSDLEGRSRGGEYRNPEFYYLAIFGDPASGDPWGWRFEGHHLSLNYTSVDDKLAVAPNFMGANPARVPSGEFTGSRLLPEEEDFGRRFMLSLDESQRRLALISSTAFPEIITGNQRIAALGKKDGIPYAALLEDQQELLDMLVQVYLTRMKPEIAGAKWAAIQHEGMENVYFAWAGGLRPGEGSYYRIHGKSFLIEYDNTQNNANHIHTVWRDFNGDFGRDLLQEHYRHSHKH